MRSLEPASLSADLMARNRATATPSAGKNGDISHLFAQDPAPAAAAPAPDATPTAVLQAEPTPAPQTEAAVAPEPALAAPEPVLATPEAAAAPEAPPATAPASALARLEERLLASAPAREAAPSLRREEGKHHIIWFGSEAEVRRSAIPAPEAETPLMAALPRSLYGVLQKMGICRPRD